MKFKIFQAEKSDTIPANAVKPHIVVILLVVASWMPISGALQVVSYMIPMAIVFFSAAFISNIYFSKKDFLFWALFGLFFFSWSARFLDNTIINAALGLLTYSSVFILALRFEQRDRTLLHVFFNTIAAVNIVQLAIGIAQLMIHQNGLTFSQVNAGDSIVGTLRTNGNLFCVKIISQSLLLLYAWIQSCESDEFSGKERILYIVGTMAGLVVGVFSSFLTVLTISAVLAAIWTMVSFLCNMVFHRRFMFSEILYVGVWIGICVVLLAMFQPGNKADLVHTASYSMENFSELVKTKSIDKEGTRVKSSKKEQSKPSASGNKEKEIEARKKKEGKIKKTAKNPYYVKIPWVYRLKFIALDVSVREVLLESPSNAMFGLGLGRYSSRAALILSGIYLRNHPSWVPISRSPETAEHIVPRWTEELARKYGGSSTKLPTSSFQSILLEFGILGSIAFIGYFIVLIVRFCRKNRDQFLQYFLNRAILLLAIVAAISFWGIWMEYAQFTSVIYLALILCRSSESA